MRPLGLPCRRGRAYESICDCPGYLAAGLSRRLRGAGRPDRSSGAGGTSGAGRNSGVQGEQGAPGNLAIRAVSDPCPQSCSLSCSENERVLNAYVVGRSKAPMHTSEQTVDLDNPGRAWRRTRRDLLHT